MSEIFNQNEIKQAFFSLLKKISSFQENLNENILVQEKSGFHLETRFQFLFNLKTASRLEAKILQLILEFAIKAEKAGPGAFDIFIQNLLEYSQKNRELNPNFFYFENIQSNILTIPATLNDLYDQIKIDNQQILALFFEALHIAGFGGKIVIEKSHLENPVIELLCGYTFDLQPYWPINTKYKNCKILVIDGFIESVSEIHHLLQFFNETKEELILFSRGMSQDVLHTLKVNFERETLTIIPVIVNFDLDGINLINDIAVIAGCDIVSSNKGNLISSINPNTIPSVEFVTLLPNKISIQNKSTQTSVIIHVNELKNKRDQKSNISDLENLLNKRIKSLIPNQVIIKLPNNKDYIKNATKIDSSLRLVKSLVDYGIVIKNEKKMAASTFFAATTFLEKFIKLIQQLGSVII